MKSIYKKLIGILTLSILSTTLSYGQSASSNMNDDLMINVILGLTAVIALLVLFVAFYVLNILKVITRDEAMKKAETEGSEYEEEEGWWSKLNASMNYTVAIEDESSIELDHNYDGIHELDNHLPPWWKYLFYLTIVFSIVYVYAYQLTDTMPNQKMEYETEMALAEEYKANLPQDAADLVDENTLVYSDDAAVLASGKKVYDMQCVACHKSLGEGGIGPNLTDENWLHGGSAKDVFKSIRYGIPDKGMIAWEGVISLSQISDVTMYINTMKGTNPPNAKDPQGEVYKED